jgi:hypothetical protein
VRSLIASRSCSATAARMWMVSLLACGLSVATNSTPESIRVAMKARLRDLLISGEAIGIDQGLRPGGRRRR